MGYIGITVCAALKGMVFEQLGLGKGIKIREFGSRVGYLFPEKLIISG